MYVGRGLRNLNLQDVSQTLSAAAVVSWQQIQDFIYIIVGASVQPSHLGETSSPETLFD